RRMATLFFLIALSLLSPLSEAGASAFSINIGGIAIEKEIKSLREINISNVVTQKYDYSCGSAAMATLLSYFGDTVEEREIIDKILKIGDIDKIIKRKGFSLLDLKRFAEGRGYKAEGYRADFLSDLEKLKTPVLLPITINNYKHFVIFRGVSGDRVFLADPAKGNVTLPFYQFEKFWFDNVFLVVSRKDVSPEKFKDFDQLYVNEAWREFQPGVIFTPSNTRRFKTH
ncbi:MAG: C39 family peptidase, partial [Thermodesulfobacteriota bacterium]